MCLFQSLPSTVQLVQGSPPASPQRSGTPPQGIPQMASPIVLNADNVAYQVLGKLAALRSAPSCPNFVLSCALWHAAPCSSCGGVRCTQAHSARPRVT